MKFYYFSDVMIILLYLTQEYHSYQHTSCIYYPNRFTFGTILFILKIAFLGILVPSSFVSDKFTANNNSNFISMRRKNENKALYASEYLQS